MHNTVDYAHTVVGRLLDVARTELAKSSASPHLDAEVLLAHVLHVSRSRLLAHPELLTTSAQRRAFASLVTARNAGQPLAYLTGEREFWSLPLKVTAATLIPRPETELLVEQSLRLIPRSARCTILDLGTGSGAIALALAVERPHCAVTATDISESAIEIARENAATLAARNVEFRSGHWFAPVHGERYRLIVSNPPYVAEGDPHLQAGDLRFEPPQALTSGPDGLTAIREIVQQAPEHLERSGVLLLEHGLGQAATAHRLMNAAGFTGIQSFRDLADIERACLGQVPA